MRESPSQQTNFTVLLERLIYSPAVRTSRDPGDQQHGEFEAQRCDRTEQMAPAAAFRARGVETTKAFRDAQASDGFLYNWFAGTLTRLLEVARTVCDFLCVSFPADTKDRMQVFLEANNREKRPPQEYAVEHFSLSEEQIKRNLAAYGERYVLKHQS